MNSIKWTLLKNNMCTSSFCLSGNSFTLFTPLWIILTDKDKYDIYVIPYILLNRGIF